MNNEIDFTDSDGDSFEAYFNFGDIIVFSECPVRLTPEDAIRIGNKLAEMGVELKGEE